MKFKSMSLILLYIFIEISKYEAIAATPTPAVPGGSAIAVGFQEFQANFNPYQPKSDGDYAGVSHVFETLVTGGPNGTITPKLAEEVSTEDLQTWTIRLRKGVMFHTNEHYPEPREVTAEDVRFSLTMTCATGTSAYVLKASVPGCAEVLGTPSAAQRVLEDPDFRVSGVTVVDRYTVRIELLQKELIFSARLANVRTAIVGFESFDPEARVVSMDHARGTGPFQIASFRTKEEVVLKRNTAYRLPSSIERLTFINRNGAEALKIALYDQILDAVNFQIFDISGALTTGGYQSTNKSIKLTKMRDPYQVHPLPSRQTLMMGFNFDLVGHDRARPGKLKMVDPLKFRQAVAAAIDTEVIVQGILGGHFATQMQGIFADGMGGYRYPTAARPKSLTYDVDRARRLLKESGYDMTQKIRILCAKNTAEIELATVIHAMLTDKEQGLGLNIAIDSVDAASIDDVVEKKQHELIIVNMAFTVDHPIYALSIVFRPDSYFNKQYFAFKGPPAQEGISSIDQRAISLNALSTEDAFAEIRAIEALYLEWLPIVPLLQTPSLVITNSRIKAVSTKNVGWINWDEVVLGNLK